MHNCSKLGNIPNAGQKVDEQTLGKLYNGTSSAIKKKSPLEIAT
jgi:hypothetical protein